MIPWRRSFGIVSLVMLVGSAGLKAQNQGAESLILENTNKSNREAPKFLPVSKIKSNTNADAFEQALAQTVVGMLKANNRKFGKSVALEIRFVNAGKSEIAGFKGELVIRDLFLDPILIVDIRHYYKIKSGESLMYVTESCFLKLQRQVCLGLFESPVEGWTAEFESGAIVFSDGTRLEKLSRDRTMMHAAPHLRKEAEFN